jgi:organic radical activating enzyme
MIRFKRIEHERQIDSPFVGALIVAPTCNTACKGCFNQHLKDEKDKLATAEEIILEVKSNIFNSGIILAGLEWLESPSELLELIKEASKQKLKIMIYTSNDFEQFCQIINIYELKKYITNDFYIKCGKYDSTKLTEDNIQFGIKLVSENQMIYQLKGDF